MNILTILLLGWMGMALVTVLAILSAAAHRSPKSPCSTGMEAAKPSRTEGNDGSVLNESAFTGLHEKYGFHR